MQEVILKEIKKIHQAQTDQSIRALWLLLGVLLTDESGKMTEKLNRS